MNKLIKVTLLITLPLITANATCTETEAFDKMMILGSEGAKRMHAYMKGNKSVKLLPDAVTNAGILLSEQKYTEACAIYDKVAKDYGVNLKKGAETTLSMKELSEDGGKKGGTCALGDASLRFINVSNILLARGLSKELEKSDLYHKASEQITDNPTKSCELTQKLADKYNVSTEEMMKEPQFKNN